MLPEIILLAETEYPLGRNAYLLIPDLKGLIILKINGRIKPVGIKTYSLSQKLPAPGNSLFLEIVTEGKVTQHLKESTVAGSFAHILQIACSDTLLAGGHPAPGGHFLTRKIGLEGRHSRIYQKKGIVIVGDQGEGLHLQMTFLLKKVKKHFSQFVYAVLFHWISFSLHILSAKYN